MGPKRKTKSQAIEAKRRRLEKERERKARNRENEVMRRKEQEQNTLAHQQARKKEEYRREERERDTVAHQQARENEEYRREEQRRNTEAHQTARENEEYRREERKRDTVAHQQARENEEYRREERKRDTVAHQQARENEEYMRKEQRRNTVAHQTARENEEYRREERKRDTVAHQQARENEEYRREERKRDTVAHQQARENEDYRRKEQRRNTVAHQTARENQEYRIEEQSRNSLTRRNSRKGLSRNWKDIASLFEISVQEGPTNRCSCCDRLWFKHSLNNLNKLHLKEKGLTDKFLNTVFVIDDSNSGQFCVTCYKDVKKGTVPRLCVNNGLQFPPIPSCLKNLTRLEERCVSARIPFMQIRSLGIDRQLGLKGTIINVPVNVDEMVRVLPRNLEDTFTVQLKLKRRMQYTHHYIYENVCPRKIYDAANYLTQQKLYVDLDIMLSNNWLLGNTNDDNLNNAEIHNRVKDENTEFTIASKDHNNEDNEPDNPECKETLIDNDEAIAFAPGEGHRPISVLLDTNAEELSFPTIYIGQPRNPTIKLSYTEIANSEIRRYDRRAARVDHLLYAFKKSQLSQISGALSVALRKKKQGHNSSTTAGDMLNNDFVQNLIQHDDGYKFLKGIRSAPAHWEKEKKRVLALIRQNGLPTLFLTLSAAESKWPELIKILKLTIDKQDITIEEAGAMEYMEKARLIREDPVTCTLYFNRRFHQLMKTWKFNCGPFEEYDITHYYYRIEFQHRGSPHVHMLIWLNQAPVFDPDNRATFSKIEELTDKFITCNINDMETMHLIPFQKHRHTSTCSRNTKEGASCRFSIPFFPMSKTRILMPLTEEEIEGKEELLTMYKNIREAINSLTQHNTSFEEFLKQIKMTENQYIFAIRSHLDRPKMFIKRSPQEIYINPFSKKILSLHRANMDIQFVLDAYACATYIIDYINKSNRGMSKMLKEVVEQVRKGDDSIRQRLKAVANTFINGSEISAQEAAWSLLRIPMSYMSDSDVYIPTNPPEERTRIIKSEAELRALDPESCDIFQEGLLTRYVKRPQHLESVCLAEYAAYHCFSNSKRQSNEEISTLEEEIIPNNNTKMRRKPKIIRYRNYNRFQDPDNFFRELIMLYKPWRNEEEELLKKNCREVYECNSNEIQRIRNQFVFSNIENELSTAIQEVEAREFEEVSREKETCVDREFVTLDYDPNELRGNILQEIGERGDTFEKFKPPNRLSHEEYYRLMQGLNERQYDFVMHVLSMFKLGDIPIHLFVTGPAGCGKSVLIKALYQTLVRQCERRGSNPDEPTVLLVAPTGKAAHAINGITAHAAFSLPLSQCSKKLIELSADVANTISSHFISIKAIIIDEISMLGAQQFFNIHRRLQQIFKTKKNFGGLSMFVFGDFRQLPPVGDRFIFHVPSSDPIAELAGPKLWEIFKIYEMTEIMRQKGDMNFANALNRMANGIMTTEDVRLLESRNTESNISLPLDAINLFATNAEVDAFNAAKLSSMSGEKCIATCFDCAIGTGTPASKAAILKSASNKLLRETYGLPSSIFLRIGARYMMTNNVDTTDGLVNGASGILKKIQYAKLKNSEDLKPYRLWILFDNPQTGKKARQKSQTYMTNCHISSTLTPIDFITRPIATRKTSNLQVQRKQFPIVAAEAITIHKSQGATYSKTVVNLNPRMSRTQLYVACSRVTSSSGLYIKGQFKPPSKPSQNDPVVKELSRLKQNPLVPKFSFLHAPRNSIQIIYHNVQSLHAHHRIIASDQNFISSDILLFTETWTCKDDMLDIPPFETILRIDCPKQRKAFGACAYARSSVADHISKVFHKAKQINASSHIEMCCFNFHSVHIIALYASPKTAIDELKYLLDQVLLPPKPTILVGDFNVNFMSDENKNFVRHLCQKYSLSLATDVSQPTTNANTSIDAVFTSIQLEVGIYESFFSHHKPIWIRFNM